MDMSVRAEETSYMDCDSKLVYKDIIAYVKDQQIVEAFIEFGMTPVDPKIHNGLKPLEAIERIDRVRQVRDGIDKHKYHCPEGCGPLDFYASRDRSIVYECQDCKGRWHSKSGKQKAR